MVRNIIRVLLPCLLLSGVSWSQPPEADIFSGGFPVMEEEKQRLFSFGGYLEETYRQKTTDGERMQNRQKLFLESLAKGDTVRGYISAVLENDFEKKHDRADAEIDEAYMTYDTKYFDVVAGKKMLRWGTGDGVNPLDLINPKDSDNLFSTARSDAKESVLLADFMLTGDIGTIELVIIPEAAVSSLPDRYNSWTPAGMKTMYDAQSSGFIEIDEGGSPEKPEAAFRAYGTFGSTDLAFILFNGYDDSPVYKSSGGIYSFDYKPLTAYGITFATGFEKSTLRGEFSVKPDKYIQHSEKAEKHDFYEWVLGWDRNFRDTGYLNFQSFGSYTDGGEQAGERNRYGISFELSEKYYGDDLKAGIRSTAYLSDTSYIAELFFSWVYGDNLTIGGGYMNIGGDDDTALGQYSSNDFLYFSAKYSF